MKDECIEMSLANWTSAQSTPTPLQADDGFSWNSFNLTHPPPSSHTLIFILNSTLFVNATPLSAGVWAYFEISRAV